MNTTFFAMLQWPEILGILVVVLILFGAKKLPELAKGLGQGIKEFKRATRGVHDDLQDAIDGIENDPPPPPPPVQQAKKVEPEPEEPSMPPAPDSPKA